MGNYQSLINKSNTAFTKDDLFVGRKLAEGFLNGHVGYPFSKETLSLSDEIDNEKIYSLGNTTKEEYWNKLRSFDDEILNLYFKALKSYSDFIGYD
ncbi:hypothetical protein [Lysinibacillus capsici]|uniref:hypothetical protein n=1 Tax=Lysinibacillus capsici TaxID=2115968 RepID=UPI0028A024DD|nr:hypothetical protein [Lysinibacillus capsici]